MGNGIKSRIVKIGNSRGIRIPKVLLDQANLGDEIEMEIQGDKLIIRPVRNLRQGWDEQFAEMARRGDDELLDSEIISLSSWDKEKWDWK
jgi:antitoxin MazE